MNTNRGTAVAATCLLLAIASQSTVLAQTATKSTKTAPEKVPAPVPVAPASGVVSTSGATSVQPPAPVVSQPSAQAAAQPGTQPTQGSATQPTTQSTTPGTQGSPVGTPQPAARPAVVSGPPPVVVGPSGRSNGGVSGVRISIGGARPVVSREKPAARSIRVGLSTTGDSPLVANLSVSLDTSANEPRSIFQIPLGATGAGSASLAATGSEGSGVHTWTRDGSTFSTAALGDSGVGQPAGGASGGTLVGSSLKTANHRPGVPFGVVNDMLTRMGGMGSVMSSRTAGVSPE